MPASKATRHRPATPWPHPPPRCRRSPESAPSWRQRSWATSVTSPGSPAPHISPATRARRPWTPPAATKPTPAQHRRQPADQLGAAHHGGLPKPPTRPRPRLLREENRRRKNTPRGPQGTQTAPLQRPRRLSSTITSTPKNRHMTHRGAIRSRPVRRQCLLHARPRD